MKKFLILPVAALAMLATSCGEDTDNTGTATIYTLNLVTPASSSQPSQLSRGSYLLNFNYTEGTMEMGARDLIVDGKSYTFTTPEQKYEVVGSQIDFNMDSGIGNINGNEITGLRSVITSYYAWGDDIESLTYPILSRPGDRLLMTYNLGMFYRVDTVPDEAFYTGTTTTTYNYNGIDKTFSYGEMLYRIVLDVDNMKAIVGMYNCRFAEEMPMSVSIILKNLDIVMEHGTYVVKGENITPILSDGTPMPAFEFDKFEFRAVHTSDPLPNFIGGVINYTVAGKYEGHFNGCYAAFFSK